MRIDWSYRGLLARVADKHGATLTYETTVEVVRPPDHDPTVYLFYNSRCFAVVRNDDSVQVLGFQNGTLTHELQRRLNDLLRPRGWSIRLRKGNPPKMLNKHNGDLTDVDHHKRYPNLGYAPTSRVPIREDHPSDNRDSNS